MTSATHSPAKFEFWSQHIAAWRASGITQARYCEIHDLKLKSFWRWKRIFDSQQSTAVSCEPEASGAAAPLIKLALIEDQDLLDPAIGPTLPKSKSAGICLHVGGCVVELMVDFDVVALRRLLSVIN